MSFQLHPKLTADCEVLGRLSFCEVLMMLDARFWWVILVPPVAGLRDLHDVPRESRDALFEDIDHTSRALTVLADADKINVAALGNLVPQLHVHVVARRRDDPLWPAPVWGAGTVLPLTGELLAARKTALEQILDLQE